MKHPMGILAATWLVTGLSTETIAQVHVQPYEFRMDTDGKTFADVFRDGKLIAHYVVNTSRGECLHIPPTEYQCGWYDEPNQRPGSALYQAVQMHPRPHKVYLTDQTWSRDEAYNKENTYSKKQVEDLLAIQKKELTEEFERRLVDMLAIIETSGVGIRASR